MKVRLEIATESEPVSMLVDTDDIKDKDAIAGLPSSPINGPVREFGRFKVIDGIIHQDGYELNNILWDIRLNDDIPVIPVVTTI